ncbi:hypothetical protein BS78_06G132900 [Paspalum vaginatum]|nr:hypothetical protein BS78_06G132900 [Paspalum vaginatum]
MSDGSSYTDDTGPLLGGAILADVAYGDDGKIYCLARDGEVHVLHLNRRRRACRRMPPIEVGPLPKLPIGADTFPPPYDIISQFTDAKNLVLCDGVLYQIWRRPSGAGSDTVDAPPGAASPRIHVFEGAVFVLRYDPGNWPNSPACWTVAEGKDLRGNAVFIGMNDAAAVPAGVEGLSDNSVYYWDGPRGGDYEAVIYNMTTGSSVRWPAASTGGVSSPVWYFLPAVESRRVEAETTDVETTSVQEAASPDHDEGEHDAHRLRKTMNLLDRDVDVVLAMRY